jgi:hypothetical protein
MSTTHSTLETLSSAQVGDFVTAALLESLTPELAGAFEAAGSDVAEGADGLLVLVDAA